MSNIAGRKVISRNSFLSLFLLVLQLIVLGCGRTDDSRLTNQQVYDLNKSIECDLQPKKLSMILEEDISEQLECVEKSLNRYLEFVATEDPSKISRNDLMDFVGYFYPDHKEDTEKFLNVVLKVNYVFFRELPDGFPTVQEGKKRILNERTLQIFKEVNHYAVKIRKLFDKINSQEGMYWVYREQLSKVVAEFSDKMLYFVDQRKDNHSYLDIIEFIKNQDKKLNFKSDDYEFLEAALFIKKLVIGGERLTLTSRNAKDLLSIAKDFVPFLFDMVHLGSIPYESEKRRSKFYLRKLYEFKSLNLEFRPDEFFLTHEEVLTLMKRVFNESEIDLGKLESNIKLVKELLINNKSRYPTNYTYNNIQVILSKLKDYLESRYFNNIAYESIEDQMNTSGPLHRLKRPDAISVDNLRCRQLRNPNCVISNFDVFSASEIHELWARFEYVAKNYRYYRNKEGKQHYNQRHIRTIEGFSEIATTRYIMSQLIWAYACPTRQEYNYFHTCAIDSKQLNKFLDEFQPVMKQLKIWPPSPVSFAQNTLLLSDLFQYQSNGDGKIDSDEITEYTTLAYTAIHSGEELEKAFKKHCPVITKDDRGNKYPVNCYRRKFFEVYLEELNYLETLPKLHKYTKSQSISDQATFLKHVEKFARDFPDDKIPMGNRDFMLVVGALLNIEATLVRYDRNNNNGIDFKELNKAFKIYGDSIMSIADIDDRDFAESAFFYMVKEKNLPQSWLDKADLLRFHYFGDKEKVVAERINIGALMDFLRTMSDIKNETLRTPPKDVETSAISLSETYLKLQIPCENQLQSVMDECLSYNLSMRRMAEEAAEEED